MNANAVIVPMVQTNMSGQNWNEPEAWFGTAAPSGGNDYVVGLSNPTAFVPFVVRTPTASGPHTFSGSSLTIDGGQFNLVVGSNPQTTVVNDLRVTNGGVIVNAVGSSTQTLSGGLNFSMSGSASYSVIRTGGTGDNSIRNIAIASRITGGGTVRLLQRGAITLSNAASTFGGTWHVGGTASVNGIGSGGAAATLGNTATTATTLVAASSGSLGIDSSVVLDAYGVLDVDTNWTTAGSLTLNANSRVILNGRNITVGTLTIGGVVLPEGSYPYTFLASNYAAFFAADGSGSITVGAADPQEPDPDPEPDPTPEAIPLAAGPGLRLISDSEVTPTGLNFATGAFGTSMNGQTFQQEAVVSHNGWQYAAYFDASKRPAVGRRKLPDGDWERIVFDDYGPISHTDVHNVNVIGICPEDGTIHISFDHHNSTMHYRRSIAGAATNPEQFTWTQGLFGATTAALIPGSSLTGVTYPQFFTSPQGKLQFCFRLGSSGNGDWHFYEYSAAGWERLGMLFSRVGTYAGKTTRSAYPNQFRYDGDGRIHITWSWREAGSDLRGNHDLGYTYSEDFGRTWKNNDGATIAVLNGEVGSANAIKLDTPGNVVYPVKYNWGYMNTTTQAVDSKGRIHVISWRLPDEAPSSTVDLNQWRYFHYWRDTDGTWRERLLPFYGRKPQAVVDDSGNIYVLFGNGTNLEYHNSDPGGPLAIATATEASGWTDWTIVPQVTERQYTGEPLLDIGRWDRERILSVYYQEKPATAGTGSPLRVLDFQPKSARELWNEEQFGAGATDPLIAGDSQAPAGDGVVNLIKYAFGMPAMIPGELQLLPSTGKIELGGETYLTTTFRRRTSSFAGVSYEVLGSEDLIDWVPVDVAGQLVEAEDLGNGFERVTVRAPAPTASKPSYFLKVKVRGED